MVIYFSFEKKLFLAVLFLFPFSLLSFEVSYSSSKEKESEYLLLDNIAKDMGADKSSAWHDYTRVYSQFFSSIKNRPIKFLEIGISQGNSVKLWEKYFKKADLHFIDITFADVKYYSKRSHYYLADQSSPHDLLEVMKKTGGDFDIILDDGGHTMVQQITSFKTLFPFLKSHGLYAIEDLHTSYWKNYGGNGSPENPLSGTETTIFFLQQLIDDVNFVGARTTRASHMNIPPSIENELTLFRKEIESMHFYDSLCIIIKR